MNTEAFNKALEILEKVPARKFNMDKIWCGSIGCALGHLAHHKDFNKLGLTWNISLHIAGEDLFYEQVAAELFDLSVEDAEYLFGPKLSTEAHMTHKEAFFNRVAKFEESHRD